MLAYPLQINVYLYLYLQQGHNNLPVIVGIGYFCYKLKLCELIEAVYSLMYEVQDKIRAPFSYFRFILDIQPLFKCKCEYKPFITKART